MTCEENSLSLSEFRLLLRDDDFVDYFNKFTCLPAFCQLVAYSKKQQQFILEPRLPSQHYVVDCNGIIEWLWRKRFSLFVKCALFHQYKLAKLLIEYNMLQQENGSCTTTERNATKDALKWLQKKCFGQVSSMRRFRNFLQRTWHGYKLYLFWIDAENFYQNLKRRTTNCMDLFSHIKEKYFVGTSDLCFQQHILNAAWLNLPDFHCQAMVDIGSRIYDIKFVLCLQKLCLHRLTTYWLPRYLITARITPHSDDDKLRYNLAQQYLKRSNTPCKLPNEPVPKSKHNIDDDKEVNITEALSGFDLIALKSKATDEYKNKQERYEILHESQINTTINEDIKRTVSFAEDNHLEKSSLGKTKGDILVHAHSKQASEPTIRKQLNQTSNGESFPEHSRPELEKENTNRRRTVSFAEESYPEKPSLEENTKKEKKDDAHPYPKHVSQQKLRRRSSPTANRESPAGRSRHGLEPENIVSNDELKSFKSKKIKHGENGVSKASSGGSESSESWEGVHDIFRKSKKDKNFQFSDRHRKRSIVARRQRFEQALQNTSSRKTSIRSEQLQKLKNEGKTKSDQQIVDNLQSVIKPKGSWKTVRAKSYHQETANERKLSSLFKTNDTNLTMKKVGGKTLLKTALVISTNISGSNDNKGESVPGTNGSFCDITQEDASTPVIRRHSLARSVLTKLPESRRMDRKGSHESTDSNAIVTNLKKRRQTVKIKPKKTKQVTSTTVTFSLSGDGPKENSTGKVHDEEKPKRNIMPKKFHLRNFSKQSVLKPAQNVVNAIVQQSSRIFTITKDYKYREIPFNHRMILALQTDHAAGNPFYQFLIRTDNNEMVVYLHFWQDIEKCRLDYKFGTMNFVTFIESMRSIVTHYLLPNSPRRVEAPESLRKAVIDEVLFTDLHDMPWELRKLQMEVLEDLKYSFESYCNQEIQSFFNAAALKTDDMIDGFQHKPGIKSSNTCTNNSISSTICIVSKPSKQWNLKNRHQSSSTEMTARMLRSQKLVLEGNLPAGRTLIFKTESEEELEVSDDDGHIQTPPPPKIVIKTPADLKHIASMAIREYPDPSKPMKNHTRVQVVEGHPHQASFYKPIKRGGLYIRRPLNRPSNFNEVLRDTTHLEFFKRYLKAHRSDRPFLFWIAVEGVKNIENVKERQQKARSIIKRYFHSSKSTADKLLQCDADIIREIPLLNIVTTSMLFTAQNIIAKMLEDRWFRKYADTFTDPVFLSSTDEIHSVGVKSTNMRQQHLRRVWLVFTDFIKRAAMFMRCMRNKKFIDLFNKFLDREIHSKEDLFQPVDDSMQSDVVAEHSLAAVPMVDPSQNMDNENERQPHKQRIVNGRLVIFDFLPTDLRFWREILSFKVMADSTSATKRLSKYRDSEYKMLKWKAKLIVNCYLDSTIQPAVRVNVPPEIAEITIESLQNGLIDGALFHEATIYIFPLLLVFWKKFCEEYYKYTPVLSKRYKRLYGLKMTPIVAASVRQKKRASLGKESLSKSVFPELKPRLTTADFPNYLHMDPKTFRRKRGSVLGAADDSGPRLTFSVSKGVTLFQPVHRRKYTVTKNESLDVHAVLDTDLISTNNSSRNPHTSPIPLTRRGRRTSILDTSLLEQFAKNTQDF